MYLPLCWNWNEAIFLYTTVEVVTVFAKLEYKHKFWNLSFIFNKFLSKEN